MALTPRLFGEDLGEDLRPLLYAGLDLDVVVNAEYLDNGVLLNFSAATEKTKSREIIELTFRIKDTTSDATNVSVEMTSIKEMDGSTIIDSTCEFVEGVVTIQ